MLQILKHVRPNSQIRSREHINSKNNYIYEQFIINEQKKINE